MTDESLWPCPVCGQLFVTRNMPHSCDVVGLEEFFAGAGDEWAAPNDFHRGRLAMMFDGEWRVAMIEDYAPDLNYGTAPYPTPDGQEDQYGIGRVGGTIVGIPRGSAHPAEAWLLVQYLATNTDALVGFDTPPPNPSGSQTFKAWVRKFNSNSGTPTARIDCLLHSWPILTSSE